MSDRDRGAAGDQTSVTVEEEAEQAERAAELVTPEATVASEVAGPGKARWQQTVLPTLLAIVTALVIAGLVIIFTNQEALHQWERFFRHPGTALSVSWRVVHDAYYALFSGAIGSPSRIFHAVGSGQLDEIRGALYPISETITTATPLIFVGLSVALGFRAGLFNIGAEGQMNVGAMAASLVGFSLAGLPGPIHLGLMVAAGFVGGAAWGFIPGVLKARTGAHEVITTIMLNFIAVSLVLYVLSTSVYKQQAEPIAKPVKVALPHLLGTNLRVHAGIFIAIGVAILVAWLLNRTTIGFEFRAVGANPTAARAAGMNPSRTTVTVMSMAGGLAGLAGANQLGSVTPSLIPGFASGLGFDGIAVALLGRGSPFGVVMAALLFGALRTGGRTMQSVTQTPIDIIVVMQALVIAFVAAPALVRAIFRIRARGAAGAQTFAKGWGG